MTTTIPVDQVNDVRLEEIRTLLCSKYSTLQKGCDTKKQTIVYGICLSRHDEETMEWLVGDVPSAEVMSANLTLMAKQLTGMNPLSDIMYSTVTVMPVEQAKEMKDKQNITMSPLFAGAENMVVSVQLRASDLKYDAMLVMTCVPKISVEKMENFSTIATRVYTNQPTALKDLQAYVARAMNQDDIPYSLFVIYSQILSVLKFEQSMLLTNTHMREWLGVLCMDIANFFDTKPMSFTSLMTYKSVQQLYRLDYAMRMKFQNECKQLAGDLFGEQKSHQQQHFMQAEFMHHSMTVLVDTANRIQTLQSRQPLTMLNGPKGLSSFPKTLALPAPPTPPPIPPPPPLPSSSSSSPSSSINTPLPLPVLQPSSFQNEKLSISQSIIQDPYDVSPTDMALSPTVSFTDEDTIMLTSTSVIPINF